MFQVPSTLTNFEIQPLFPYVTLIPHYSYTEIYETVFEVFLICQRISLSHQLTKSLCCGLFCRPCSLAVMSQLCFKLKHSLTIQNRVFEIRVSLVTVFDVLYYYMKVRYLQNYNERTLIALLIALWCEVNLNPSSLFCLILCHLSSTHNFYLYIKEHKVYIALNCCD